MQTNIGWTKGGKLLDLDNVESHTELIIQDELTTLETTSHIYRYRAPTGAARAEFTINAVFI